MSRRRSSQVAPVPTQMETDGLCGIPSRFQLQDGSRLLCRYELTHGGPHDWEKYRDQFRLRSHCGGPPLGMSPACTCTPVVTDMWEVAEFIFDPNCQVHK